MKLIEKGDENYEDIDGEDDYDEKIKIMTEDN